MMGSCYGAIYFDRFKAIRLSWISHLISRASMGEDDLKNSSYARSY